MRTWVRFAILLAVIVTPALSQSSDMGVTKTGTTTAAVGGNVVYSVTIFNNGPDDAANATLTDNLPSGATFVSEAQNSGSTFSCSTPPVGASGGVVTCNVATFASGSSATFTITVKVSVGSAGTALINNATASSASADPNPENDTASWGTAISGGTLADVAVFKSAPAFAAPGSNVTFTITVTDFGPNDASTVSLIDTLGAGLTFVSLNQISGPAFSCPGSTTPCTIATLPNGATATFNLVATVSSTAGTYTNTSSLTSANDPNPDNDSASASVTVASADVGIVKSAPATSTAGGASFTYIVTLSNSGPDAAQSAAFTDILPAGITFVSLTQNTGPTASCNTPPGGSGGTVTCSIPTLLNGESAQFSLVVNASPSIANGTVVTNTATASSATTDTNSSNNSSSASTTISSSADVTIAKTGPTGATVGSTITYSISVGNNGPSNAAPVSVSDTLPSGTTFASLTQNSGPMFTCSTGATITCTLASMASGATATFTLVANVVSGTTGSTITNTATMSSLTTDPNPANNSSTTSPATLGASADVSVSKTGPATVPPGGTLSYTITVSNAGPSAASSVSLTDAVPTNTTFVSIAQTAGPTFNCTSPAVGATGTSTCTIAALNAAASATFTFTVKVNPGTGNGTIITNAASVASPTPDSNLTNNSANAATTVANAPSIPTLTPVVGFLLALMLAAIGVRELRLPGNAAGPHTR